MGTVTLTLEEYMALLRGEAMMAPGAIPAGGGMTQAEKAKQNLSESKKRKTRYQAAYKRNFNKIKPGYLKKNGQWKQGGFKRAVKEAHRITRKQVS